MRNENYTEATIVHLSPSQDNETVEVASFDEAFGAHSNLFGKGRARRTKRKSERQANRQKKRMTRINNRQERKSTRKSNRQANKQNRVEARATKKATRQDARLTRKANRKASRGSDDDIQPEDDQLQTDAPVDSGTDTQDMSMQDSQDQSGNIETTDTDTDANANSPQADDGGETEMVEETDEYNPEEENEESEFQGGEFDLNFNDDEGQSAFNDEISGGQRRIKISAPVMDTARKIVWNEELVSNFESRVGTGENDSELHGHIENRKNRIEQLESMLGEYSEARGGKGGGRAARSEVKAAKKAARQELKAAKHEKRAAKKAGKKSKSTSVAEELNPEISKDEISIPAEETEQFVGGTGTGISSTDQSTPQNIAPTRTIELTSNVSGPLEGMDWKTAGITAGVVVGILVLLKVTKVL